MGLLDVFRGTGITAAAIEAAPEQRFSMTPAAASALPSPYAVVGSDLATWQALVGSESVARVSRRDALSVTAVKRAVDLISGTISTLPIWGLNAAGERVDLPLLQQPEGPLGLVRSVTLARTVCDLIFDAKSLWLVLLRRADGFPQAVQRVDVGAWSQDETGAVYVGGREVDPADIILFTSPIEPLLSTGARAIRQLLALERAASLYAATPEASYVFKSADGVDPDPQETQELLNAWESARAKRSTAYVPSAFSLEPMDRMSPESLQLISAREFAVTEIARLTGIDASWLAVPVTTHTYFNASDVRRQFTDFVLAPYIAALEQRLSMNDVCPRGTYTKVNLNAFLRADTAERYASYAVALTNGFLTIDEVRALEDRPPLGSTND